MAAYCAQLTVGYIGPDGHWVWSRQVMVIMAMVIMGLGKCSGDVPLTGVEDCVVYLIGKNRSLVVPFEETLTVGFPLQTGNDVLADLSLIMETDEGNVTIQFNASSSSSSLGIWQVTCSQDGLPATEGKSLSYPFRFDSVSESVHIPFFLSDGVLNVSDTADVCSNASLSGGNSSLKITSRNRQTNVVFNCQEGCLIYADSKLPKHKLSCQPHWKELYIMRTRKKASATLRVTTSFSNVGAFDSEIPDIYLVPSKDINIWKKLSFNIDHDPKDMSVRYAELKLEQEIKWNHIFHRKVYLFETSLKLVTSKGLKWSVGCDPRKTKGITSTSEPTGGHHNKRSCENCTEEYGTKFWQGLFITVLLVNTLAVVIFFIVIKKKLARVMAAIETLSAVKISENSASPVRLDPGSFQGPPLPLREVRLGNERRRRPSTSLPPLPESPVSPTIPLAHLPTIHFSVDHSENPRDPLLPQRPLLRRDSSTIAHPTDDPTPGTSTGVRRNVSPEPPEGDDNEDEHTYCYIDRKSLMEQLDRDKRKRMSQPVSGMRSMSHSASGISCGLKRHDSVNSLYEEAKWWESEQL